MSAVQGSSPSPAQCQASDEVPEPWFPPVPHTDTYHNHSTMIPVRHCTCTKVPWDTLRGILGAEGHHFLGEYTNAGLIHVSKVDFEV